MVFVRKVKSRNSICFQIGKKQDGRFVLLKHVGCAVSPPAIEALKVKASEELARLKFKNQLALFPQLKANSTKAKLLSWRITGFHQVFGTVYDQIGLPDNALRDLVVARIVFPKSKLATSRYLEQYLGIDLSKDSIYRLLDKLSKDQLTKIAYQFVLKSQRGSGSPSLFFYDVTTLYFESEKEDNLRRKGYSKDKRNDVPQILLGLFVNQFGYPLDFDFFQGKTFEGHTFPKAIKHLLKKYCLETFTIVADAGMLSQDNLQFLTQHQLTYIVAARLKKLPQKALDKVLAHDFNQQPIWKTNYQGKRLIVSYSLPRAKKDQANRKRQIKALEKKLAQNRSVVYKSKYLAVSQMGKVQGIDQKKIKQDQQFDGLKGYFTNLKNLPNKQVIKQYHKLWQVEKAFRMSKSDLKERPIYHYLEKRIKAHLSLCFVSLLVMKETEKRLKTLGVSLKKAIELLGKVGQGEVRVGRTKLEIDSEVDKKTQLILNHFAGH